MISIIVPALNEEQNIGRCMERIREECSDCEIIVADGGSIDRTPEIVSGCPDITLILSEKGRGLQMNAGAAAAKGDILLFLHADTWLGAGWLPAIESALEAETPVVGGAFSLKIDNPAWQYRLIEAMVRLRCLIFRLPYGDQAIFVRRDAFEKIGGYPVIPLMEDVEMISRMKKAGCITVLRHPAYTDARRWERKGIVRTSISNLATLFMYKVGMSPHKLAKRYYK
jgi:rSAM/selenodomain-associated transferase 2